MSLSSCLCPQNKNEIVKIFWRRAAYEVVTLSIPVFVAAGVNNFVASIIVLSSEDSEDPQGAEIGQQFLYTFFFSYLIGKWLFHAVAKHIIACQASQTLEDRWGLLDFCKRTKSLTLLARAINENASFSIKEFMMLVLVEKVYEEEGFGAAFGGWWLGFGLFVLVLLISTLMASGLFRLEGEMVHWLKEYDVDSFALGAGAVFVALVGKGLSVEGVTFISPNSVLYGDRDDDSDDFGLVGYPQLYNVFFTFTITFWCGLLLLIEDKIRGVSARLEVEDEFAELLPIPPKREAATTDDANGESLVTQPLSVWETLQELLLDYYHTILGCICGVAYFLLFNDNIVSWLSTIVGSSPPIHFLCFLLLALLAFYRAPAFLLSGKYRAKAVIARIRRLQSSKTQSLAGANGGEETATDRNDNVQEESRGCCTPRGGNSCLNACWADFLEHFYRTMLHRRRLIIISVKLLVGWSWEVVVTAFFRWITDTIALSMEQQVGVRFAILVLILCLSAMTFYVFKDEDEAYKIDPYAPRTANTTTATSAPSSHRSPVSPPMSVVSNPLQNP